MMQMQMHTTAYASPKTEEGKPLNNDLFVSQGLRGRIEYLRTQIDPMSDQLNSKLNMKLLSESTDNNNPLWKFW